MWIVLGGWSGKAGWYAAAAIWKLAFTSGTGS